MSDDDLIAQLIATAQPRTREVRVCARGDLVDRHAALVAQLAGASEHAAVADPEIVRISGEIVAVEEEQEASTATFVMQSVSRRAWADLLKAHPPRKEDRVAGLDHNPDTFPQAMVAACCQTPALTVEDAEKLMDVLPTAEWAKLWNAGITLNVTETPHPKLAAASELARANGGSSATQVNGASPAASS